MRRWCRVGEGWPATRLARLALGYRRVNGFGSGTHFEQSLALLQAIPCTCELSAGYGRRLPASNVVEQDILDGNGVPVWFGGIHVVNVAGLVAGCQAGE